MLIYQDRSAKGLIELHHLGMLNLRFSVGNPNPVKKFSEDPREEPMIGSIYQDAFLYVNMTHDFYFSYEKRESKKSIREKVSFTKPVYLLRRGYPAESEAMIRSLVPIQHPAVTHHNEDSEISGFNIPDAVQEFFGWDFILESSRSGRFVCYVYSPEYSFLIENGLQREVERFFPPQIIKPMIQTAPDYVLNVVNINPSLPLFESIR